MSSLPVSAGSHSSIRNLSGSSTRYFFANLERLIQRLVLRSSGDGASQRMTCGRDITGLRLSGSIFWRGWVGIDRSSRRRTRLTLFRRRRGDQSDAAPVCGANRSVSIAASSRSNSGSAAALFQGIEISPRRQRLEPLQPIQQSEIDLCRIAIVPDSLQLREPTSL